MPKMKAVAAPTPIITPNILIIVGGLLIWPNARECSQGSQGSQGSQEFNLYLIKRHVYIVSKSISATGLKAKLLRSKYCKLWL
jgi:hypothetical protein